MRMIPGPSRPSAGRLGWWIVGCFLALVAAFWLTERAVDWLWMGTLGYRSVFWQIIDLRFALFAAAFFPLALVFWLNLRWALRLMEGWRQATGAQIAPALVQLERSALLRRALPALLAFIVAIWFAGIWDDAVRFLYGGRFGLADPLLGRDVGFYVFRLPLVEAVVRAVFVIALLLLLAQAGLVVGLGVFRDWTRLDDATRAATMSALGWNLAAVALASSAGYILDRFSLLYASSGTVWGPGYVDVHVVMPALWLMAAIAFGMAVLAVAAARRRDLRLMAWGIGGAVGAHLVLLGVLPAAIQAVYVDPNELDRERQYLEHNIAFTRRAFGIDGVSERSYSATQNLEMRDLADNQDTVRNIRLWDYRPLLRTFSQIQQIRLYYQFYDVDVDRYRLADGYRQTMLSARELTPELPERARTWVNRHLQYTHGYGFAMSLAAQEGEEGTPTLVVKDLPPAATRDAPVGNPAIYYGEHMPDYVIAPSGIHELDYPSGDDNVYASYHGAGGVPLGSLWSRLLFTVHLMDFNILLTDYSTEASRIHIRRSLQDRVHRIAPFLRLDRDPYMVTTPEGLSWIQDAYTTSDRYPYSETYNPAEAGVSGAPFNYIRNSVKVVMDAYDGSVALYVMDPEDPVLAAYRRAFPELFRPLSGPARGAARAPAISAGPLPGAGHPLRRLPHARPAGVLQQGGPLDGSAGEVRRHHRPDGAVLRPDAPPGRGAARVHADAADDAAREGQPDRLGGGAVGLSRLRPDGDFQAAEGAADLRADAGRGADRPEYRDLAPARALGPARLAGAARQPAGDPDRPFPALRGAGVPCRRTERLATAQADDRGA